MEKRFFLRLLFISIIFCFYQSTTSFAQSALFPECTPTAWDKNLDVIETKFNSPEWTPEKIDVTINDLTNLQKKARACVSATQDEINRLNMALALPSSNMSNSDISRQKAIAHLDKRKNELDYLQAECQLFLLHSQETVSKLNTIQRHLIASLLFSRSASVWENLNALPALQDVTTQFDTALFFKKTGIQYFNHSNSLIFCGLILIGVLLSWIIRKVSIGFIRLKEKSLFFTNTFSTLYHYVYALLTAVISSAFFVFISWPFLLSTYLAQLSILAVIYILSLIVVRSLFYPPLHAKAFIPFPEPIPQLLAKRLFYLLTLISIFYVFYILFREQTISPPVPELGMTLFITLLNINLISIIWLVTHIPKLFYDWKYFRNFLSLLFDSILVIVLFAEWLGYHLFAVFLVKNIAASIALIFIAWILQITLLKGIHHVINKKSIHHLLGIRPDKHIQELFILQPTLLVLIWGSATALILKVWVLSEAYFNNFMLAIMNGFSVAGLFIVPSRILLALVIFVLLGLSIRGIKSYVTRHSPSYVEGGQVTIGTIVGYVGFLIILLITLVIAGVNFTGLAIIAGALSVGIGFGLQGIANNFISGIILLIENPIRPGDRIQVGDVEGFVKRIRLRATQITTLRRSDIFIPNSELISKNVTNFMFRNTLWRIVCGVGVAYGSNIDFVKEILLQVAAKHPGVIQDSADKPQVFFRKFNDSSLFFELSCLIHDVNKRYHIESELNFAIANAFKENEITIAYPQQDVHIKDWPGKPELT